MIYVILHAEEAVYGAKMLKGQLHIISNARPVSEVLRDPSLDPEIRRKLLLIQDVRKFAFDSIGLKPNNNYTKYFDQKGKRLVYLVTACEPFALSAFEWEFPVLGRVPYKGFFNESDAVQEAERIRSLGYDTDIGGVSGWSTLGFFNDPILSQMLNRNDGELAELIIHELTHGTVFIKDEVELNENLATFVGEKGAEWFLINRYKNDTTKLHEYKSGNTDSKKISEFMLQSAKFLEQQYQAINLSAPLSSKRKIKKEAFDSIVITAKRLELINDTVFADRFQKRLLKSGNTVFMHYVRYEARQDDFEEIYKLKKNNLRAFVDEMRNRYEK
ncbi:MAG: aminopeptidase [Bacteroidia bacterium]